MGKRVMLYGLLALIGAAGCLQLMGYRLEARWRGKPAPDFALRSLDGEDVKLSDFRGRPVVLTFFGST